jgi:hypothetical protein
LPFDINLAVLVVLDWRSHPEVSLSANTAPRVAEQSLAIRRFAIFEVARAPHVFTL